MTSTTMNSTPFIREIFDVPTSMKNMLTYYDCQAEGGELLQQIAQQITGRRKVIFTGMGASHFAPDSILHECSKISPDVESWDAGELLHFGLSSIRGDEILIAVSQSGESVETKLLVQELHQRIRIISIVNDPDSSIAQHSHLVCPMVAGEEASISVKTYTNTLMLLSMIATALNGGDAAANIRELTVCAHIIDREMETYRKAANSAAKQCDNIPAIHCIARGSDMTAARHAALMLNEGAGVFTQALTAGAFRHGPIELAGEGHAGIGFCSANNKPELTGGLLEELAVLGSRIICLTDVVSQNGNMVQKVQIECPAPRYFPLMCIPFMAYFTHYASMTRGREAGIFRHATKVTIRE